MSAPSPHPIRPPRAFTLIELLVSVAVLAVMLVLLSQLVSLASRTWTAGKNRADTFTQAKVVLGAMDRDIRSMVLRRDLASFVDAGGNPSLAFYTRMPAPGGDRKLSLVSYQLMTTNGMPELQRSDLSFSYGSSTTTPRYGVAGALTDLNQTTSQILADGVARFEIQFIRADGSLTNSFHYNYDTPSAPDNTRSLVLSLLVLDTASMKLADETGNLSTLLPQFSGSPAAGQTYAAYWNTRLAAGANFLSTPETVRRGFKTFERHVQLPIAAAQ